MIVAYFLGHPVRSTRLESRGILLLPTPSTSADTISRIDYCNFALAGALKALTDKLKLNAGARVTSDTGKFDRGLTQLYI